MRFLTITLGLALVVAAGENNDDAGPKRGGRDARQQRDRAPVKLAKAADADKNGEVTAAEWTAFLKTLKTDENGVVEPGSLRETLGAPGGRRPPREGGRRPPRPEAEEGERPKGPPEGERGRRRGGPGRDLDIDQDGKISLDDLNKLFAKMDKNGDKTLQADELKAANRNNAFAARILFRLGDADRDEQLTAAELDAFLKSLGATEGEISVDALMEKMRGMRGGRGGRGGEGRGGEGRGGEGRGGEGRGGEGRGGSGRGSRIVTMLDYDGNGKLTESDLTSIFKEADKNGDKILTKDEVPAGRGRRGGRDGAGQGERRPSPGDDTPKENG